MSTFDYSSLDETSHRPWPKPRAAWVMTQTWHDLLFAHWPVDAGVLRAKVPAPFEIDLYDGQAWVAVVPFHMTNVAPRFMETLPWTSAFPELNVRTYVHAAGKPGVFFFSLDAGSSLAVATARGLFNLPYHNASMRTELRDGFVQYSSRRRSSALTAEFAAIYRPVGPPAAPEPGSLEHFLTERYCLYALDRRSRPYRLEIHHPPWQLQPAVAEISTNTMAEAAGISLPSVPPLLHYAARQDMVGWLPRRLEF